MEALERLDAKLRASPRNAGAILLSAETIAQLGWTAQEAREVMRGLGFTPAGKAAPGEPTAWRPRRRKAAPDETPAPTHSPFAALAALKERPPRRRRPRRRLRA